MVSFSELKACFEHLNTDQSCRAIVLTGSGKAFSTGKFFFVYYLLFEYFLGLDVKYLSTVALSELGQIDDVARKAFHLRRMIQRTQASLRAVDKVKEIIHSFLSIKGFFSISSVKNQS